MTTTEIIKKWDSLTEQQKASFGDRFITHESNIKSWSKPYNELSELKKNRVLEFLKDLDVKTLFFVKGFGI